MKFSQFIWDLYKSSQEGQSAISLFSEGRNITQDILLIKRYNPDFFKSEEQKTMIGDVLADLWDFKVSIYGERSLTMEEAGEIYDEIVSTGFQVGEAVILKPNHFADMIEFIPLLSLALSAWCGDIFFPYLYINGFHNIKKFSDYFDINLPEVPKKSDYKGRCMYYWSLCEVVEQFRVDNSLSMPEFCALVYDYAPKLIEAEVKGEIPQPSQAWFIGGRIDTRGEAWTTGFWQANVETKKGDILIHYETYPISAITCIWVAQVDGVVDPFFKYYSHTYVGDKKSLPSITLKELQQDEHFSKHPLVRKKFQGVNGWAVTSDDYSALLRLWQAKGVDTKSIPRPYAPVISQTKEIKVERDVETKLLEPLLKTMGFEEYKDYIRQLPIHAGRGHRIFPDYALHYCDKPDEETARVLIEAKYHMKSNQEIEAAFLQARSYAMLLDSSVIILCDKNSLLVYERKQSFDRDRYTKLHWGEFENPDRYNALKNILR